MITVLADDITGAAEIAGIAKSYGMETTLEIDTFDSYKTADKDSVAVVATDTRSCTKREARIQVENICRMIRQAREAAGGSGITLFKKTDSVLRGNIGTELLAAMHAMGYSSSLLIAQNPSKGRIIRDGEYLVGGVPLSETMFRYDPEFPATSSTATKLITDCQCRRLPLAEGLSGEGGTVFVADAESYGDILMQLDKADASTLIAGGADCFRTLLDRLHVKPSGKPSKASTGQLANTESGYSSNGKQLVVCGSTQSRHIAAPEVLKAMNAIECSMPDDVFDGAAPDEWIRQAEDRYHSARMLIIRVGEHELKGADYARRIKAVMAKAVRKLVETEVPARLIIEGGATAYATLSATGWRGFSVWREYAPGVVGMKHGDTEVVVKPGSYPWGGFFG